jgi:hypothetical protein
MKLTDTNAEGVITTAEFDANDMDIDSVLMQITYFLRGCSYIIESNEHIGLIKYEEQAELK